MSAIPLPSVFMRAVQLRHLRCFVAVAQERHLARAALRLSISQPAVSKTIGELEALAQGPLVVRTTEGRRGILGLTEAGERLLSHSIAVLDAVGAGAASLTGAVALADESLRLGVLTCLCSGALPRSLARLVAERPELRVTIDSAANLPLMEQLRAGSLDLVLGRMSDPKLMHGLSFELLHIETLACVVRSGHRLLGQATSLQEILTQVVILHPPGTVPRQRADTLLAGRAMRPPARLIETSDFTLAKGLVRESDAVWITPRYAVREAVEGGTLAELPIDCTGAEEPIGLFRKIGRPETPVSDRLARMLRSEFGKVKDD